MDEKIKCSQCGTENDSTAFVCIHCGSFLNQEAMEKPTVSETQPVENNIQETLNNPTTTTTEPTIELTSNPLLGDTSPSPEPTTNAISEKSTEPTTTQILGGVIPSTINQPNNINSIPGFENYNPNNIQINKKKNPGKTILIVFLVLIVLGGLGFGGYKLLSSNTITPEKGTTIGSDGKKHNIGGKSSYYDKSLEEKIKYLLNQEPFDKDHYYLKVSDGFSQNAIIYKDGTVVNNDITGRIYNNFLYIPGTEKTDKYYDRNGELVMEEALQYIDDVNIFKDMQGEIYTKNGKINEYLTSHSSYSSYFSFEDEDKNISGLISIENKITYKTTYDKEVILESEKNGIIGIDKYCLISENEGNNRVYKIINCETGKEIYKTQNDIEKEDTNYFEEDTNTGKKQLYINNDKVLLSGGNVSVYSSDYFIKWGNDIYEHKTGNKVDNSLFIGSSGISMDQTQYDSIQNAFQKDNLVVSACFIPNSNFIEGLGLKQNGKELINCSGTTVSMFKPEIYNQLKAKGKTYAIVVKGTSIGIYDVKKQTMIYNSILAQPNSPIVYTGSSSYYSGDTTNNNKETEIINLITGKTQSVVGGGKIIENGITITNKSGTEIYNQDLEKVYTIKPEPIAH